MKAIYIPEAEMPKEYGPHEITIVLFVRHDGSGSIWGKKEYIFHEPLDVIPLPDHGRLIDADALVRDSGIKEIPEYYKVVRDAPTIIPASKVDE